MNPLPIIVKKCVVNRSFIDLLEVLQAVTMFSRYRCLPWTLFAVVLANIFCLNIRTHTEKRTENTQKQ